MGYHLNYMRTVYANSVPTQHRARTLRVRKGTLPSVHITRSPSRCAHHPSER